MLTNSFFDILNRQNDRFYSRLGQAVFGPNISCYQSEKPGLWSVAIGVVDSGFSAHFDAVVDDFGDLVRVGDVIA